MLKKLGMTGLMLASAIAVLGPQVASAQDRDDYRYRDNGYRNNRYYDNGYYNGYDARSSHEAREWREHEQREWREHERREHLRRYNRGYQNGYYDRFGYWHPYGY